MKKERHIKRFSATVCYHSEYVTFVNGWGYTHDRRADKYPYPHDRRADKDSYPHDRNVTDDLCSLIKL